MHRALALVVGMFLFGATAVLATSAVATVPADARWSGESTLRGVNGHVDDAVAYRGGLAICGSFTVAGDVPANNAAWWDGTAWHELGGAPKRLIVIGDTLIAAQPVWDWDAFRYFTQLAHWTGEGWRAFGGVLDGDVRAMAAYRGDLVVGGSFANADRQSIGHIARWDGAAWHSFPYGPNLAVDDLAATGDSLVVAGEFTWPSPGVALWDGTDWRAMSNGLPRGVCSVCLHGGSVLAGGSDSYNLPIGWVSRWDGSAWQPLTLWRPLMYVNALVSLDGRLFVSGGDMALTQWLEDGGYIGVLDRNWREIASSASDAYALRTWGHELVALGVTDHVGSVVAAGLAVWNGTLWRAIGDTGAPQAVFLAQFQAERRGPQALVQWSITQPHNHAGFYLWRQESGRDRVRLSQTLLSGQTAYDFTDPSPPTGPADYWLQEVGTDGTSSWYGPAHLAAAAVPSAMHLYPAAPNPFNPRTTIRFDLPAAGNARLAIYDVAGRLVKVLVDGEVAAGTHEAVWDGRDAGGRGMASGSYFARLQAGGRIETVRMGLVR